MIEERDWYGRDWKKLRSQLLKLCLQYGDEFLASLSSSPGNLMQIVYSFIENIERDILHRIPPDRLGLWQKALPFFANKQLLFEWLENDKPALLGEKINNGNPVKPRQALGRKLCQYFEQERRQQIAAGYGVSANRIKTWERLDRISREVAAQNKTRQRCSEEHFIMLAEHVKEKFSHDKNLPRKTNTIQDYFYQFSDDCYEKIDNQDDGMEKISLQEARDLLDHVGMAQLSRCLNRLSGEELEIVDAAFQLGIGKVQYLSLNDFLEKHSLTAEAYEQKRIEILSKLRFCLECSLHEQRGGSKNEE